MTQVTFTWKGKKITCYEYYIGGMPFLSMDCEPLYEMTIAKEVGAIAYPNLDLPEFQLLLAASGLTDTVGATLDE